MFDKLFWEQALERALKSAAQGAVAAWGAIQFTSVDQVLSFAQAVGYAALSLFVLSLLTSIASAPLGQTGTPSLVETPVVLPDPTPNLSDEYDFEDDAEEEDNVDTGSEVEDDVVEEPVDPEQGRNV